jgi:hypothetical protein
MTENKLSLRPTILKVLRSLQTLAGAVAIILIPFLWGAWSPLVLGIVLGTIIGSAALVVVLSHVLHGPFNRGELKG